MIDLLRTVADVTEVYCHAGAPPADDDASADDHAVAADDASAEDEVVRRLVASRFDRYIYWQTERLLDRVLPMDLGPSFVVPAFDAVADADDGWWLRFVNCHLLSFTRAHHERLRAIGCVSSHFQFFPDPGPERARWFYGERAAFWPRSARGGVDARDVVRQCRALGIARLHVLNGPDAEAPPPEGNDTLRVTVSRGTDGDGTCPDMCEPLFFVAPRVREGAGTACLDAMARGQIVVAADDAVVNEYVAHRCSGFLYAPGSTDVPPPVDDAGLVRISRAARRKAVEGRRAWLADADRLLSIVTMDARRWSTSDASAGFGTAIRRAAHRRLHGR